MRSRGTAHDVEVLAGLWRSWAGLGRGLEPAQWRAATRLPGWTVRTLFAHVARSVEVLDGALGRPVSEPPRCGDAREYFAVLATWGPEGPRSVDRAARQAATAPVTRLVHRMEVAGPAVLDAVRSAVRGAGRPVLDSPAGPIALPDYVLTRVVEATVHLLDAAAVLPRAPRPSDEALGRTADVLVDLVGADRFVEHATGRSPASPFPALS